MSNFKTQMTKIHYNKAGKVNPILMSFLNFCSLFYNAVTSVRNFLYDKLILKISCVNARVISVGNLTTGGVGKTPVVAEIADHFANKYGEVVCILSRGYGGNLDNKKIHVIKDLNGIHYSAIEAGDEPFWLSKNTHPEVIVITCADRVKGAEFAVNNYHATKIILDDGFQHRRLYRDTDVILIDSEKRFGNNKLLPSGPLRENLSGLNRADIIYVVSKNTDHTEAQKYADYLKKTYKKDVRLCKIEPDEIYNIKTGEELDKIKPVSALCAIGQPEQFVKFLEGLSLKDKILFDDHHIYTKEELSKIDGNVVTTEKDAVKLKDFNLDNIYALKLKVSIDINHLLK
ncbi:tetraacyldisaccharide 4'-kinase [bacterium]|nr:tetraacyldisaccharide 4'-kinase [bacterium]